MGTAAGAAMVGMRPVVEMGAPFFYVAFDQLVSIIAKSTYLYGGQAKIPITLRATMLYGGSMAAQHSDRPISTLMTIPGISSSPRPPRRTSKACWRPLSGTTTPSSASKTPPCGA